MGMEDSHARKTGAAREFARYSPMQKAARLVQRAWWKSYCPYLRKSFFEAAFGTLLSADAIDMLIIR